MLALLAGDRERLGWWTLPAFLIVGLAGAVLSGALVVVWQTQKIQALEDEIASALAEMRAGVEEVEAAGEKALADIAAQVGDVEAVINAGLPVDSASEVGVVVLRVDVPASSSGSSSGVTQPAPGATTSPTASEPASGGGAPVEQESVQPAPPDGSARVGSAVAVAVDGASTFFATSYALVADPSRPGEVLQELSVDAGQGRVRAVVHAWDRAHDLALVRAEVGPMALARWRAQDEPVVAGERVFLIGLTTSFATVQQPGTVTFDDPSTLLTDHDVVGTLRGGAIVDSSGRLIGIGSADYRPLVDDDRPVNIPIRLLCASLLRACDSGASSGPSDAASNG